MLAFIGRGGGSLGGGGQLDGVGLVLLPTFPLPSITAVRSLYRCYWCKRAEEKKS